MEPRKHRVGSRPRVVLAHGAWAIVVALTAGGVAAAQGTIPADEPVWDQVTTRVSVGPGEVEGNRDSELWGNQAISGDGRFVVFSSYATNLVPGDTNRLRDIFLRDRLTGETTRVSVSSDGQQPNGLSGNSCISADSRSVALDSYATNLVPGDTNLASDVFIHDRVTGETTRVSTDSSGNEANGPSARPSLSADGRFVAFKSLATNLVPGDTNNRMDVFLKDRVTGETTRVSVSSDGTEGDRGSSEDSGPAISADGRYVAFQSAATNLVRGDSNHVDDVFVHDRVTGETTRVSVRSDGAEANGPSWYPSLSADGRYVAFASVAANLIAGDMNGYLLDVFVHDRLNGQTTVVSVRSDGTQGDYESRDPAISGDGRYVTFSSGVHLAPGDGAGDDIFVHDRVTGETTCASVTYVGVVGFYFNANIYPSISADGRYVAFSGGGPLLVPDDWNREYDVFVRGPEITLESEPAGVGPGQTLTLTVYKGVPGNSASLWVVRVNGARTLALVAAGSFTEDGNFVLSGLVPPGLAGETITFRGYALGHAGFQIRTNDVTVSFL
ncbi:MAG: calcium-binding protein [Planctomycetota bacterium]